MRQRGPGGMDLSGLCSPGGIWLCSMAAIDIQSRMKMGHPKAPGGQEFTMRASDFLASREYFVHIDVQMNG